MWEWKNEDAFGNNAPNEDPSATGTAFKYNLRFPGQYFDQETGTHYNYFRDYDPGLGRYVQSDPVGLKAGVNTYAYVSANPVRNVDRYGLETYVCAGAPRSYVHSWLCADKKCAGLMPAGSAIQAIIGGPGVVMKEEYRADMCFPYRPRCKPEDGKQCKKNTCDITKLNECVAKKIEKYTETAHDYSLTGSNCFTWSQSVLDECQAEVCEK